MSVEDTPQDQEFPADLPQGDWLLSTFVSIVTTHKFIITITLQVDGCLVSGVIASGREYFDALGHEFSSAFSEGNAAEIIQGSFANLDDEVYEDDAYIHLRDAQFLTTQGPLIPTKDGVWWRGRISEVAGFVLGRLSAS